MQIHLLTSGTTQAVLPFLLIGKLLGLGAKKHSAKHAAHTLKSKLKEEAEDEVKDQAKDKANDWLKEKHNKNKDN